LNHEDFMRLSACLLLGLFVCAAMPGGASAEERKNCPSSEERRAIIGTHKAGPFGRALRVVKAKLSGEVVKERLCRQERGLVYVLTVLARDGKVTQAWVDAADGRWLEGSGG
jgi:hypothetical protein